MGTQDGADVFSQHVPFGVAQGEQVVHMRAQQYPPPECVSELVHCIIIKEGGSAALGEERLEELLPRTRSLLGSVKSFSKLQYKSRTREVRHIVAIWLFNPDIFFNGGIHKCALYIPVHAREIGV